MDEEPALYYRRSAEWGELLAALAKAQGEFVMAEKDAQNPAFRSKYSSLAAVVAATQAPLSKHGLALMQVPSNGEEGDIIVTTILGHQSGQWLECSLAVKPTKSDAQGIGSAMTYLRRYSRMAVLGIAPEDDDGEVAVGRPQSRPVTRAPAAPPPPPPPPQPPHDPETGEIKPPHRIPVPTTKDARGMPQNDWIKWGSSLIAAIKTAKTQAEVDAWQTECEADMVAASEGAPRAFRSVDAAFAAQRAKIGPEDDSMVGADEAERVLQK